MLIDLWRHSTLKFYRARYYDPQLKRFVSSDPIGLEGGLNTYAYVGNNPLKYVDPLGLSEVVFDRSDGTLTIIPDILVVPVQQFPAGNNTINPGGNPVVPESNGPAPNGTFPIGPLIPTGNDPNSAFGNGFFPIDLPAQIPLMPRTGVGLHSGRANRGGPAARTLGCVRTTDDAIDLLRRDPPRIITIQP